jgi:hypothetical protein
MLIWVAYVESTHTIFGITNMSNLKARCIVMF